MGKSQQLLDAVKDIWDQYSLHPFVKGIEDGSLDREKFRWYIVQDYLYLEDYARTFAIGAAKVKSAHTARLFSSYVNVLTGDEMDIHRGYMGVFGFTKEELDKTERSIDSVSYTSYMLRIAYEESEAEILAAVLSCAYSYEVIAKNMVKNNPDAVNHPFYGDWVKGYISEEYSKENKLLLETLDSLCENYTEKQTEHLKEIFTLCSRYELAFWDLAWNMSK